MSDVIYLLIGGSGEWEDYRRWIVRAYLTDAEADHARHVAEQQAAEAEDANKREEPWEAIRDRLTIDPEADIEQRTHYFVEAVEVAQGIEAATAAETVKHGSVHESPVAALGGDAPNLKDNSHG